MRILIIEDDKRIASSLKTILEKQRYIVHWESTAENGEFTAKEESYDMIILDWMLPDGEGIELCRKLRKDKINCPILMLTAKSQIEDIVTGLEGGADDYLTKPFSVEVLLARIKVLLRRKDIPLLSPILQIGALTLDTNIRKVMFKNKEVMLAPKEYMLLEYLVMHPCQAIDRMTLLENVWGETIDELSNTVDVHIRYLRKKIDEPFHTNFIKTIKNKGYMICQT